MMKNTLLNAGLFPETLPPCFISKKAEKAFSGLVRDINKNQFHAKKTDYVRYSVTKHDGSRRLFGTPNIVTYFHISRFIFKHWGKFEENFALSKYSIGRPKLMDEGEDRAVKVPSLSELSKHASKNLRYAPYVLKSDIAQCFHSIYTHSIPWAIHGIEQSKSDRKQQSAENFFNALDFFIRNGQRGHTRGVLIGPDAYRLVAEFVLARIDEELHNAAEEEIVGAARHVDDYYIGIKSESDAQFVLSKLREILATYELHLNDQKTHILSSIEPINDLWAQRLKDHTRRLRPNSCDSSDNVIDDDTIERAITEAVVTAQKIASDSPLKILFRSFDEVGAYNSPNWEYIEQNMLRIIQKHPHSLDYACLLAAKRHAIGEEINTNDWRDVAEIIIKRGLAFNHHHEVAWMLWLMIVTGIEINEALVEEISKSKNAHILSMLVQAYVDGKIAHKPKIKLGSRLSSVDENWLLNLVSKSQGYSGLSFSGAYSDEFEHLATKKIKLVDFKDHIQKIEKRSSQAISRTRYGYDDDSDTT